MRPHTPTVPNTVYCEPNSQSPLKTNSTLIGSPYVTKQNNEISHLSLYMAPRSKHINMMKSLQERDLL